METQLSSGEEEIRNIATSTIALIVKALAAVKQPTVKPANVSNRFTVTEDLTILKWFHEGKSKGGNPTTRGLSKSLAEKTTRSYESIRQRYKTKLVKLEDVQIQKMCDYLTLHESDGICDWKNGEMVEINPIVKRTSSKDKAPKAPASNRSSSKKKNTSRNTDVMEIEEDEPPKVPPPAFSLPIAQSVVLRSTMEVIEEEPPTQSNLSYPNISSLVDFSIDVVHELYRQPDDLMNVIFELADVTGIRDTKIYEQMKACSMEIADYEQYLNDPKLEPYILWSPEEDEMLLGCYEAGKPPSMLIKFKGEQRVARRMNYLEGLGVLNPK